MSVENPMTVDEAFRIELLQEARKLILRLEEIDKTLGDRIKKSSEEGAGKAFLAASFRYEELLAKGEKKIAEATRKSTDNISSKLNDKIVEMTVVSKEMYRNCWGLLITITATSLLSGIVSGCIIHFLR